jgi:potassium uptake TrkH family protein
MLKSISRILSFSALSILIYDFGFNNSEHVHDLIQWFYFIILILYIFTESFSIFSDKIETKLVSYLKPIFPIIAILLIIYSILVTDLGFTKSVNKFQFLFIISIFIVIIPEFISIVSKLYIRRFSPAIIFVGSFFLMVVGGTLLLLLPNATTNGISFIDALFTSTSAVCITGLVVLDTGKDFTLFGQTIILFLFQLGGIGMLTLTSFFAYFFKGTSSYQENLYLKDFLSSEHISGLLSYSIKIVIFTLLIEAIGAALIYVNIPQNLYPNLFDRVYFAVFHSVSAFCNAGFSTLTNSFYEETFRFNYNIHLLIAFLFIVGGLGYNVIFNLYKYFKFQIVTLYKKYLLKIQNYQKAVNVITLNTKIVVYTSLILMFVGTLAFFIGEYNNTLVEHTTLWGKIVTAFFGGNTPRSAGFNTVDTSQLTMPIVMITLLLMWIGAGPASTGGGIKTSTFAIAMLNLYATVTGKNRIEVGTREIPQTSVNRAFTIISISLLVLGISIFLVSAKETHLSFIDIAFECFSAYAPVGLSLGITAELSDYSKIVLSFTMFIGRVGAINILIGMLKQIQSLPYRYPQESVLIN